MVGPRKLEGKSRVCNQPEALALQSSVPCYWKVQGMIQVVRCQPGADQLLLHKARTSFVLHLD